MSKHNITGSQLVSGAILVEVLVNPDDRRVYFPDLAILRNKTIKHIDYCDELSVSPTGKKVASWQLLDLMKVTFVQDLTQIERFKNLPISELATSTRKGNRLCFNHVFKFNSSYIDIAQTNNEPYSLCFVFWFDEPSVSAPIEHVKKTDINYFELELTHLRTQFEENRTLFNRRFRNIFLSFPKITAENKSGILRDTSKKSFLTLSLNNLQFFQSIPLYLFYQTENAYQLCLENIMFDFTNSFIEVVNPSDNDLKTVFFNCIIESE